MITAFVRVDRGMAQVIVADWGLNEEKEVLKKTKSYVYCKRGQQSPFDMIVKYTLRNEIIRRETKYEE